MAQPPSSVAAPGFYPPTDDPLLQSILRHLAQINAQLLASNVKPGTYTLKVGSTITVNAQGQITSIVP